MPYKPRRGLTHEQKAALIARRDIDNPTLQR